MYGNDFPEKDIRIPQPSGLCSSKLRLYRVTSSWVTEAMDWNNKASFSSTVTATQVLGAAVQWYSWNIAMLVKNWYDGIYADYGFCLKRTTNPGFDQYKRFLSSNVTANLPALTVTYSTPAPVAKSANKDQVHALPFTFQAEIVMLPAILLPFNFKVHLK